MKLSHSITLLITALMLFYGCDKVEVKEAVEIIIEAESFSDSKSETLQKGAESVSGLKAGDWLQFKVNVPVSGRYKCEVFAYAEEEGSAVLWMEDYVNNTDGRTYNITGGISFPYSGTKDFISLHKDGSPLGKGSHDMKLNVAEGTMNVHKIKFTLIRKNKKTPKTLTQSYEGEEWEIAWSDEFEGKGIPDTAKWTYDIGNWGWGNNEPQYYTQLRTENARQEDGNLIIEARKNDMGQEWTSARLTTRGKVSFLYGKIEFRAKVPSGDGTWAAGWTLGDSYVDEISWPYCGEIDILENVGREIDDETGNGINHASCHTRAFYFKQGNQITAITQVENMTDEFHTYSVEWTPEKVDGFVDGKKYYTYDKHGTEHEWPFDNPQNLIVNLAIGGGMGGEIDENLTSQKLIVDYVRVYKKK